MAKDGNKTFVLRIDVEMMEALEQWADDEFRSINGQLLWIIADALRRSGRTPRKRKSETAAAIMPETPDTAAAEASDDTQPRTSPDGKSTDDSLLRTPSDRKSADDAQPRKSPDEKSAADRTRKSAASRTGLSADDRAGKAAGSLFEETCAASAEPSPSAPDEPPRTTAPKKSRR